MKTLIPADSPLYVRRMVRELSSREHGFYVNGMLIQLKYNPRCRLAASVGKGAGIVCGWSSSRSDAPDTFYVAAKDVEGAFFDHNGQAISASRH